MTLPLSRLGCTALRYKSRVPLRQKGPAYICPYRAFHPTPPNRRREDREDSSSASDGKPQRQPFKFSLSELDTQERSAYDSISAEEQRQWREEAKQMHDYMTSPEVESELQGEVSQAAYETSVELPHSEVRVPRIKSGFFAMGEEDPQDTGEDGEFKGDDITSLGHGELEQHREMRHYARIAAWEMPLLSSTAPPSSSLPRPIS